MSHNPDPRLPATVRCWGTRAGLLGMGKDDLQGTVRKHRPLLHAWTILYFPLVLRYWMAICGTLLLMGLLAIGLLDLFKPYLDEHRSIAIAAACVVFGFM